MTCPKCGAQLPDDAVFCAQCGASVQAAQTPPPPGYGGNPNPENQPPIPPQYSYSTPTPPPFNAGPTINGNTYLIFSILATVLCCIPLGIPAIVYATKIDKAQAMGDYVGAQEAAKKSKMWSIIAAVSCAVVLVLYFIFIVLVGIGSYGY